MTRTPRQEVWLAMSDLFLDTDVSLHRDFIVRTLMASPYDLETLDAIFIQEVYPVCIGNLLQIAGEWAGFAEDQLFERISRRSGRRVLLGRMRIHFRWGHVRRLVPEWFKVRAALEAQGKA